MLKFAGRRQRAFASWLALALWAAPHAGIAKPDVRPPSIATAPLELADLIVLMLPPAGDLSPGWGYVQNASISWQHAGYDRDTLSNTVREGLARVRVQGRISIKLAPRKVEVPWTVRLRGSPNPARGVISAHIEPGDATEQCLGFSFINCKFEADDVFRDSGVQSRRLCFTGGEDENESVYAVAAPGHAPGYAIFTTTTGPDGVKTWVDIVWREPPPSCIDPQA